MDAQVFLIKWTVSILTSSSKSFNLKKKKTFYCTSGGIYFKLFSICGRRVLRQRSGTARGTAVTVFPYLVDRGVYTFFVASY